MEGWEYSKPGKPKDPAWKDMSFTASGSGNLSAGNMLHRALTTLSRNPTAFFGLASLTILPQFLLGALLPDIPEVSFGFIIIVLFVWTFASIIIVLFVWTAVQGALAYSVYHALTGKKVSFGDAIRHGFARFVPLMFVAVLSTLGIALGMVCLVLPGLFLICVWAVAAQACAVEGLGPIDSLKRSFALTQGARWPIFALVVAMYVLSIVVDVVVGWVTEPVLGESAALLVSTAFSLIPHTFEAVLMAVVYFELRSEKEGVALEGLTKVFD